MNEHLKAQFVDFLFEEYMLSSFIWKMMSLGVNIDNLDLKNHEIVCDIIGFPKAIDASNKKTESLSITQFRRDSLSEVFSALCWKLNANRVIILSEKGLTVKEGDDEPAVRLALNRHVEWLFSQYKGV